MAREVQKTVLDILKSLRGLEPLKRLFWSELNYERVNQPLSRHGWTDTAASALTEDPVLFAGGGENNDFHVIYARLASDRLLLGDERPIVSRLMRDHPYALFVISNVAQDRWHFLNIKYDEEVARRRLFRRITIGPEERLRTASERLSLLDLTDLSDRSPLAIQERHDEAFDVEAVQKDFFRVFAELYHKVADDISKVHGLEKESGKLAQLLLNRMLFLYFIQKKGWLDQKPDYLYSRFQDCWKKDTRGNSYYSTVLYPLFISLSNSAMKIDSVGAVPFLNGGLFEEAGKQTQGERLEQARLQIKNTTFKAIFDDLLERFNFTVTEDTPLDIEVAIDPEMLGKIFESLVLQLEKDPDQDLRKITGSYYTHRPIVHFMCQEALKEYLITQLVCDDEPKAEMVRKKVGELISLPPADHLDDEQVKTLVELFTDGEAKTLRQAILDCRVCDPAVGSGAFPVGMLHEMVAAIARFDLCLHGRNILSRRNYDYDLKKQIIESSLYGVDIQEQAVRLCELRLWLSLIVDYQIDPSKPFEKAISDVPCLPNLSYRIVRGDSLLEHLFGHVVQLDQMAKDAKTKQVIESIQADKQSYFREGDTTQKRKLELKILAKQADLAERLIEAKRAAIKGYSTGMFGEEAMAAKERKAKVEYEAQIKDLDNLKRKVAGAKEELERVGRQKGTLDRDGLETLRRKFFHTGGDPTFIWRVDFAEVFVEKGGFDIMIANPPYLTYSRVTGTTAQKSQTVTDYKEILRSTYPKSAEYKLSTYAIFMNLSIINLCPSGILVYITPDTFLTGRYFSKVRSLILEECRIRKLVVFLKDFWEQGTIGFPTISVLGKEQIPERRNRNYITSVFLDSEENLHGETGKTYLDIPQTDYQVTPYNRFRMYRSLEDRTFVRQLEAHPNRLDAFLEFHVGIRSKVGSDAIVSSEPKGPKWKRGLIDGNEVLPFKIRWKGNFVEVNPQKLWAGGFSRDVVEISKILIRKTGNSIIAAIDRDKFYHLDILHSAILKKESCGVDLPYLVALLNSNLMDKYYKIITMSYGRVMAQTNLETLESLPIVLPSRNSMERICEAVKIMEKQDETTEEYKTARRKIETVIATIYLKEKMGQ
jgi:hypothetical protein